MQRGLAHREINGARAKLVEVGLYGLVSEQERCPARTLAKFVEVLVGSFTLGGEYAEEFAGCLVYRKTLVEMVEPQLCFRDLDLSAVNQMPTMPRTIGVAI